MQNKNRLEFVAKSPVHNQIPFAFSSSLKSSGINTNASQSKLTQSKSSEGFAKSPQSNTKNGLCFTKFPKDVSNLGILSKSYINRDTSQNPEMINFMQEIDKKLFKINQTLAEHQKRLNDFNNKQYSSNFSITSSNKNFQQQQFQRELTIFIRKQLEKEQYRTDNPILREVERVRSQLNQVNFVYTRKEDLDMILRHRIETELFNLRKEFNENKDKDKKSLLQYFKRDLEISINNVQNSLGENIRKLEFETASMKATFRTNKQNSNVFSSRKKFYDPKIIRYRETLQRLSEMGKSTNEPVLINQVIYYMDKDGFLLDNNGNYLIDDKNQQIQLQMHHLDILRTHLMLI